VPPMSRKFQIPSTKSQRNSKSQIPMSQTTASDTLRSSWRSGGHRVWNLVLGIWDLESAIRVLATGLEEDTT
jgi:hypothetical protein